MGMCDFDKVFDVCNCVAWDHVRYQCMPMQLDHFASNFTANISAQYA